MSTAEIEVYYKHLESIAVERHEEDERGNIFTLLTPIHHGGLTVPVGFESDGASVPRIFWPLVFPRDDLAAMYGAIVHDYIYRVHPKGWSRRDADESFQYLLERGDVPPFRAQLAYWGVRFFGGLAWNAGGLA